MRALIAGLCCVLSLQLLLPAPLLAQQSAIDDAPRRVLSHWTGDIQLSGEAREGTNVGRGITLSGNGINIDPRRMGGRREAINTTVRLRIWVGEDGILYVQADNDCTGAMFPVDGRALSESGGGRFDVDYAYTNAPARCTGGGQVYNRIREIYLYRTANEDIRLQYYSSWNFTSPYQGRAEVAGETLLRAVYETVQPQRRPNTSNSGASSNDGVWLLLLLGAVVIGGAMMNASGNSGTGYDETDGVCTFIESPMRDQYGPMPVPDPDDPDCP